MRIRFYKLQNKVTKNGTDKSITKPWYIETIEYSLPEVRTIIGKVVSIVVAPPAEIGARLPKYLTNHGAKRSVITSRIILESKAIVPSSIPLHCVIKMLDKE